MPGSSAPVVLDAMGGDRAPREQVAGAVAAVREHGVRVAGPGRHHGQVGQAVADSPVSARS